MKILMTKFANNRNEQYHLSTRIYEKGNHIFVSKSVVSDKALKHLHSLRTKYRQLEHFIINPRLKVNKILEEQDSLLIFEYVKGIPFEKLIYQAISQGNTFKLKQLLKEFCELIKKSFNLKKYEDISNNIPDKLKKVYKKKSLGYFNADIPFDLTPGNIFIKEKNDTYEIIDYEWTVSFPLPIEFIIYRALHCCALQYDSEAFFHHINVSEFANGLTFDEFSLIESQIMAELQPYKQEIIEPNLPDIQFEAQTSTSYPNVLFSQLYIDYGDGYSEEDSIINNIDEPLNINEIVFSLKDKKKNIREIRFDPLNVPCALKINQIVFLAKDKEIFTYNNRLSNGINDSEGIFYFSSSDPQFFLNDIPANILNSFDTLKITLEFISYGKTLIDSFGEIAKNIYESLQQQILIHSNSLTNSQNTIEKIKAEKKSLQKELSDAKAQINMQKQQLESLEKRINAKHIEITALELKHKDLISKIELAEKNNQKLIALQNEKNALIKNLEKEIKKLKIQLTDIREEKEKLTDELSLKLQNKEEHINNQIKELEVLRQNIIHLEQNLAALQQNNALLDNLLIERDIAILKYRRSIHEYRKSRSWRMTEPYRRLDAFICKLAGGKKHG